jgi:S-adenosylmethionine synthetase
MEVFKIKPTKSTPEITLDHNTHIHTLKGESYPENSMEFYKGVFDWLDEYIETLDSEQEVIFNVELVYFNSSSSKVLMDMFDLFDDACENGKNILVNWIYEEDNEAILEYGEEFAEDYESLNFHFVVIE